MNEWVKYLPPPSFCGLLDVGPCLSRFHISNVTTSSGTTYVFSDSVEQMNRVMRSCYPASAWSRESDSVPVAMLRSGCLSSCSINSVSVSSTCHPQMVSTSRRDQVLFLFKPLVSSIAHGTQEVLPWLPADFYTQLESKGTVQNECVIFPLSSHKLFLPQKVLFLLKTRFHSYKGLKLLEIIVA